MLDKNQSSLLVCRCLFAITGYYTNRERIKFYFRIVKIPCLSVATCRFIPCILILSTTEVGFKWYLISHCQHKRTSGQLSVLCCMQCFVPRCHDRKKIPIPFSQKEKAFCQISISYFIRKIFRAPFAQAALLRDFRTFKRVAIYHQRLLNIL